MLGNNSVKCHNSGLERITKLFRLVINILVYWWQCSRCFIGLKEETHTGKCIRRFGGISAYWPEVVNIGVNTI